MYEEHRDMLTQHDKGVLEAEGVLARLFRQILFDNKVTPYIWGVYMNRYLDDPVNRIPRNSKERSSARGNLNKELRRPRMTWKVFRKGLKFLGPIGIRFEVHLTWPNGKQTVHPVTLSQGDQTDPSLVEPEDEES